MNKDLRILEDLKSQLEKGRANFRKSPKERISEPYIQARLEGLEDLIQKFTAKHENLIMAYDKEELEANAYMKNEIFDVVYETYLAYKTELKTSLQAFKPSSSRNCTESSVPQKESVVRLPKISIPIFSGSYSEWSSFKDLFLSLVHNNAALDDVQRLHYLKTQVTGEAEQLLKHIPITTANYVKCWELLKQRYDNKRFMSNCILKRLFSLRSMTSESSQSLKLLVDTTSDCINELGNLGVGVQSWDIIIIYIISSKLDCETRKQWELSVNVNSDVLPTYTQFKEFLESRFRALELIEPTKNPNKFNNPGKSTTKVMHVTANTNTVSCPLCQESHRLYSCGQFAKEDISKRQEITKSLGLCFNCLGNGHTGRFCRVTTKCRLCKGKHHTLLHGYGKTASLTVATATEVQELENDQPKMSAMTNETTTIANHFVTGEVHSQTLLATALIKAESHNGSPQILRALLDQGSQGSFISEAAVQFLRLKKIAAQSCITGLGGDQSDLTSTSVVMVTIQSLHDPAFQLQVQAHVLKTVTSILPDRKFVLSSWTDLGNIKLADPRYNVPDKIDILLGSEVYSRVLKKGLIRSPSGSMIAQDTYLGWVVSGQVGSMDDKRQVCHNVVVNLHVKLEEHDLLKKFWELESEPNPLKSKILTEEEQACENHFTATTRRDITGRYIVELPFRPDTDHNYGDTRTVAVKRLVSLERRLDKTPEQKKDYARVLTEYLALGHMEEVTPGASLDKVVYLPHHAVIRNDKTTTKTRVVFNASSKCSANNPSLNDTLMVGPKLQPELRHTIMRWRLHPICLTADIIKMYRQVRIAEEHSNYQRIVWRQESHPDEVKDYRLMTVTFGTSSAPYLAVKALQQVALDEGHHYPEAAKIVKTDFYMDDLLTGCQSETETRILYKQMNELLKKGGFILQKWTSNRMELLDQLEENDNVKGREIKEDDVTKVVGLAWNRRTDEFDYSVKWSSDAKTPETKRGIISEICRLYDPLGWIAPCVIIAKIFIQKLWLTGYDWDDKLPEELIEEWRTYREEMKSLVDYHLPRWVQTMNSDIGLELHGFSDASNAAYAAVVYVRCIAEDGSVTTHLVTAKTKVAPIKQVSIPRLELCGAVLLAKLLNEVAEVLNVKKTNLHAWTDSTIVLAWLSDHPSRWKTFVANRSSEILTLLDATQWSYVQSTDNPADSASRGISPAELLENTLWKNGPRWLRDEFIPYGKPQSICNKTDLEKKNVKVHAVSINPEPDEELSNRFSSWRKMVRVVAYCRRFLNLKEKRNLPTNTYLTAPELEDSRKCCLRQHQTRAFPDEIASLLKGKRISNTNNLSSLNPFIDREGILRVGGRIEKSDLPDYRKHPIIVCGDSHFAKLIVADAHERTLHGGQQLTCNYIRGRFWITKLKSLVRSHIHGCVSCIRNAAKTSTQLMGQLPVCRVTPSKPFLHSGVDYAGPINIRTSKGRGYRSYKGFICLFVCMATRAVHIEAVSSLTSEGFLSAFKRFVARRGRCTHMWSDNGTNFVGAAKELKHLLLSESSSWANEVASSLASNGTEWHFIPPHAPHFGGIWEAGIKSTKHHLRRVIGDSTLTYEELSTVLVQVEACLNSRPLSALSVDADDPMPLTPGHFLVGEPMVLAPDHNFEQVSISPLRRWQLTQRMLQHFWKRWSQEYLTHFFQRYKWKTRTPELRIGAVVLVKEDNLPPTKWLYGRVEKVHPGKDGINRVVTLRYKNSLIQRPIAKLCPLPIE